MLRLVVSPQALRRLSARPPQSPGAFAFPGVLPTDRFGNDPSLSICQLRRELARTQGASAKLLEEGGVQRATPLVRRMWIDDSGG
jgi:hypothetical protein